MPASASVAEPRTYRGDALRAVAMPLCGIGTGTISLAGDGSLRQWQIHNQVNHLACVPHSFFAVWCRGHRPPDQPVARVLQSAALHDTEGPPAPPTSNDHLVPPVHRRLLRKLPGVAETEFVGAYPIAELRYHDDALPLDVSMAAFNPFAPLDAETSGIPAILFDLTLANPTDRVLLSSVAMTLQNAAGWDGVAPIFNTACERYGGNHNTLVRLGDATLVEMGTTRLAEDDPGYGSTVLAVGAPEVTALAQWADLDAFWSDFAADGRLGGEPDAAPSPPGRTWNAALAVPMTLQPGERRTIPFTLAWHFPNRYVNYDQRRFAHVDDPKSKFWLGNRYATRFRSALDVAAHVADRRDALTARTRLARDTFHDTALPVALIDAVVSQTSVVRSPTCFWTKDGNFRASKGATVPRPRTPSRSAAAAR